MSVSEIIQVEQDLHDSLIEEEKAYARAHLLPFTLYTMKDIEGFCFYDVNWHHKVMAKYLDRFVSKQIKRLLITAPPRHGKSELVSRRLPAFILGRYADDKIISTSYSDTLATMMNRDVQRIMSTKEYKTLFPETYLASAKVQGKSTYARTTDFFEVVGRRGSYRSCGIGGGISGMGANYIVIDDPIKNSEEAYSKTIKEKMWDWYLTTLTTRLEKDACLLITLTRWFEDDLAGRVLKFAEDSNENWVVLNFPAIKEPSIQCLKEDPRKDGEALWPNKYSAKDLSIIKQRQAKWWSALYQGDPKMAGGNIIQKDWFRSYKHVPTGTDVVDITQFWDTAQKADEVKNAPWVCGTWVRTETGYYLINVYRAWHDYPSGLLAVKALYDQFKPHRVIIEDKSTGSTLLQTLPQTTTIPVVPFLPQGDKDLRLHTESDAVEQGLVYLPEEDEWLELFLDEIGSLPQYPTKDQGDMLSMSLKYFRENSVVVGLEELAQFYEGLPNFGEQYARVFK